MSEQNLSFVPEHLKTYIVSQNYDKYTPREHATWRFIMRQSLHFFKHHAHQTYLNGLKATGIPVETIPRISEMDQCLQKFGWRAVGIRGFIPTLVFLDFQSRSILPIATDMRTLEHIGYTPSPDIVHEAAGHAPILTDHDYGAYIAKYATIARKCIYSDEDIRLYEAIRALSDVKENPDTTEKELRSCLKELESATHNISWVSEATLISRFYWWTAEYGLVGTKDNPKIFGAGLLSSVAEGKSCIEGGATILPLDLKCLDQDYDITEPQPQLFLTQDFSSLSELLQQIESKIAYKQGGLHGLQIAQKSKTVCTTVFECGLSVSGQLTEFVLNTQSEPNFIRWSGPVQICHEDKELEGHGIKRHKEGMSTPLGKWIVGGKATDLSEWTTENWERSAWQGREITINHEDGYTLNGVCMDALFCKDQLAMLTFSQCTLTSPSKQILFQPEWGEFDMIISSNKITSVYGGPADWQAYGKLHVGESSTYPGRQSPYTESEVRCHEHYKNIRKIRDSILTNSDKNTAQLLDETIQECCSNPDTDWLIGLELIEILSHHPSSETSPEKQLLIKQIKKAEFMDIESKNPVAFALLKRGLEISDRLNMRYN